MKTVIDTEDKKRSINARKRNDQGDFTNILEQEKLGPVPESALA